MIRLSLTVACLASAVACTQATAKDLLPRPHAAKGRHVAAVKSASPDAVRFSDPYAPPEGATSSPRDQLASRNGFPVFSYPTPVDPQARLSISMQKDGMGHTTGGFGWNF